MSAQTGRTGRRGVWAAGLIVAAGAGVATAHGLYQVAAAAQVPSVIAWLYPLITDGLALVAYAATSRLTDAGRRYAWAIVVLAAGLSGLAQAVYLAGGIADTSTAPVGLRFGVGAWPAVAAALTAHLLHLISADHGRGDADAGCEAEALTPTRRVTADATSNTEAVQASNPEAVQAFNPPPVQPYNPPADPSGVRPPRTTTAPPETAMQPGRSTDANARPAADANRGRTVSGAGAAPASERARHEARSHYARQGTLPTVTELMELAQVARGTAGTVLKDLRDNRPALHIVNADNDPRTHS